MDTADIAIVVTLAVGFVAIVIAMFAVTRQANSETQREMRELNSETRQEMRQEIRDLSGRLERISEIEREQARMEGANGVLSEILQR